MAQLVSCLTVGVFLIYLWVLPTILRTVTIYNTSVNAIDMMHIYK